MRNLVVLSVNLPLSLDRIISNMSPFNFSMTTNIRSSVSNIRSKLTTPGCDKFCNIETSFFSWASCLVGNRNLSITLMATARFDLRSTPTNTVRMDQIEKSSGDVARSNFWWRVDRSAERQKKGWFSRGLEDPVSLIFNFNSKRCRGH